MQALKGDGTIGSFKTFDDIVKRFDILYNNDIPHEEKLSLLYRMEAAMFPKNYDGSNCRITSYATVGEIPPRIKFPEDQIYITLLAAFFYFRIGQPYLAGSQIALWEEMFRKYRETHVNGVRVRRIVASNEDDTPAAWIDMIGGEHDCGCGTDPYGNDCGECSRITCEGCKMLRPQNT